MENVTQVLATTNEISLKGGNRKWFERTLTDNIRSALSDLPVARVERPAWRVLVTFSEPVRFTEVARRINTVFGINSMMPVEHGGHTLEDLQELLGARIDNLAPPSSFAVRCIRSNKRFPMTSPDIEREVGTFVQDRTSWAVNLRKPELTVHLLVDENGIFVWFRKIPGPGGLPTGVGGRAVCLLSGGIDSPVAAYSMLKRGMRLDFVHFHSMPRTNPASIEKVREVVRQLNLFQGSARLATVPLLSIQEEIVARCPADLRVLLYRRFMFRISERIAREFRGHALVTGEALGQVSSQTVENVASVEAAVAIPVLRPLISFDKQEIIRVARQIGTYDVSIEPHMDCCSFLMPDNPATRSEPGRLSEAESVLDVDGMVEEAVEATERTRMTDTVDWQDMPAPEEATF